MSDPSAILKPVDLALSPVAPDRTVPVEIRLVALNVPVIVSPDFATRLETSTPARISVMV